MDNFPLPAKNHNAFIVHRVLDHGFIRLVDSMPSPTDAESLSMDSAIAQAARTSYGKGTKSVSEDKALINYLMKHRHTSPFEMVELKFHCRMPIFVARQWIRHRTASVNEYSARYSEVPDIFYKPEDAAILGQSKNNKQGSEGNILDKDKEYFGSKISTISSESYEAYQESLNKGISRETARMLLPVNYYTEWYWKIDLHNLFRFISLRADHHAQMEIRVYAEKILEICRQLAPVSTEAFENHMMNSISISREDFDIYKNLIDFNNINSKLQSLFESKNWNNRKKQEFINNLNKIKDC